MLYEIDNIDVLEICSSFCFVSIFFLIDYTSKNKRYYIGCLLGLILSSLYYHSMEKLHYKYSYVNYDSYETSTFFDNYFIILMSGNILFSPFNSLLISSITFKNNIFKKLYFISIYLNTVKRLYFEKKIFEMYISLISSVLISYCIIDYSFNGWYLLNSWVWHMSNLTYIICSCNNNEKLAILKCDCFKPIKTYASKYLRN